MSEFAPGLPTEPVRLHLYNDTVLDNLLECATDDFDAQGYGLNPSHVLVPIDVWRARANRPVRSEP